MRVKICGLTRVKDVELAVELGADALGFIYEESSPRYVGHLDLDVKLLAAVEPYSVTVAVYGRYIQRRDRCAYVQAVELSDKNDSLRTVLTRGYVDADVRPGMPVFRFEDGTTLVQALTEIDERPNQTDITPVAILLDGLSDKGYGGTGARVDWDLAQQIVRSSSLPVILAGGLNPDNVAVAVSKVRPYAVDVSSGIESSPGVKDPIKMRDFIQAAREAGSL